MPLRVNRSVVWGLVGPPHGRVEDAGDGQHVVQGRAAMNPARPIPVRLGRCAWARIDEC